MWLMVVRCCNGGIEAEQSCKGVQMIYGLVKG